MNFFEYLDQNTNVALCLIPVLILALCLLWSLIMQGIRSLNIAMRGWPPKHLDASGTAVEEDDDDVVDVQFQ